MLLTLSSAEIFEAREYLAFAIKKEKGMQPQFFLGAKTVQVAVSH